MSDEEVIRALLVLARKLGVENRLVVAIRHGIGNREEVTEEQALCLAFGVHGAVRLCCTYGKDHAGACSWERAMVGKSACIATTKIGASGEWLCQRPSGHAGEHKATGADGVRWAWGDAPRELTPSEKYRCGAQEWGTNGHRMSCVRVRGHEGAHRGVDADGNSTVTWPCPCYPAPCTGHTVPGDVDWRDTLLTTDSPEIQCAAKNATENPVMAGQVCNLLRGHVGPHMAVVGGQRWLFGAHEPRSQETPSAVFAPADPTRCASTQPGSGMRCIRQAGHEGEHRKLMRRWSDADPATTDEPGTVCEAPSPLQPGPDCVYRAGHVGSHSNDPTEPRAS